MRKFLFNIVFPATILLLITHSIKAQETFSSDCKPEPVSSKEAESKSKDLIGKCGFSSVFFQAEDINQLIATPKVSGVRFYISKEISSQEFVDVIAVAINEKGEELEEQRNRSYLMKKSLDDGKTWYNAASGLSVEMARAYVENIKKGKSMIESYTSYLGADNLASMLERGGDGIRVYSSEVELDDRSKYNTMSFGAVVYSKDNSLEDITEEYWRSNDPCPTLCGGDGDMDYLWNSKEK